MRAVVILLCLVIGAPGSAARRGTRRLGAAELEPLARAALTAVLPEGVHLRRLVVPPTSVGEGALRVDVVAAPPSRNGRFSVPLLVTAGDGQPQRVAVTAELDVPSRPTVARGSAVAVIVRQPGIFVSIRGTLQASAVVGDPASVLTSGGRRVLVGQLIDAQTVEVSP